MKNGMKKASVFEASIVVLLILLTGLLFYVVTAPPPSIDSWELNSTGKIDYVAVGSDDTLYVFAGNNLTAIGSNGRPKWTYEAPGNLVLLNGMMLWTTSWDGKGRAGTRYFPFPVMAEDSGHVYLYAFEQLTADELCGVNATAYDAVLKHPARLVSLTPAGQPEWVYHFNQSLPSHDLWFSLDTPADYRSDSIVSVTCQGGRIYLFHDSTEDVLDSSGKLLFSIPNLSAPAAVDENGYLYGIRAFRPEINYSSWDWPDDGELPDGLNPGEYALVRIDPTEMATTDVAEAYYPNGSLAWSQHVGNRAIRAYVSQDIWTRYNTLPLYCNHTLYIPVENGITAVRPDGVYLWTCQVPEGSYRLLDIMPMDSSGNVYLKAMVDEWSLQTVDVRTISPRGYLQASTWTYDGNDDWQSLQPYAGPLPVSGKDGLVYAVESNGQIDCSKFNDTLRSRQFGSATVSAYDARTGTLVWNFSVPAADRHVVTLDEQNYGSVISRPGGDYIGAYRDPQMNPQCKLYTNETQPLLPATHKDVKIYPGNHVTYVYYYSAIYEYPVIFDRSRCIYAKGLYALSDNGSLIWSMPVDGFIEDMAATNNTVYYATRDGRIGSSGAPAVAAGITLAAFAYLFLRFFAVGAVARARNKLNQNENRMQVLQYVIDHPGASAVDISRDLRLNAGTTRYHLLILTLNHKIVTYQDGDKYLRYFRNSGSYAPEERMFLALARREPVRKTLHLINERPGISSLELAGELGISSTATLRHVGLLVEKGVVDRRLVKDKGYVYTLRDQYLPHLAGLAEKR